MLSQKTKNTVHELLKKSVEEKFIAGANMLVLQNQTELLYDEYGMADIEAGLPMQRNTIFRFYSMTKPITGAAAMIAMERGMFDLTEAVSQYIPGFKGQMVAENGTVVPANREVLIRDLLSMTSGLIYCGGSGIAGEDSNRVFEDLDRRLYSDDPMTTAEFADRFGHCRLLFQPGERFEYGTSADILGAVIEAASGMKYSQFLQTELFEPLDMVDTGFTVPASKRSRLAKVYEATQDGLLLYTGNHLGILNKMDRIPAFESGGAGLTGTVDDYSRFATMLSQHGIYNDRRILSESTFRYFTGQSLTPAQHVGFASWIGLEGYTYGNLLRVMKHPEYAYINASLGEYGWDGWLGTYFINDPIHDLTFLFMIQKRDAGTTSLVSKLRNVIATNL